MSASSICLVVAATLFAISFTSPWWGEPQRPYWNAPVAAGLFFLTLSFILR